MSSPKHMSFPLHGLPISPFPRFVGAQAMPVVSIESSWLPGDRVSTEADSTCLGRQVMFTELGLPGFIWMVHYQAPPSWCLVVNWCHSEFSVGKSMKLIIFKEANMTLKLPQVLWMMWPLRNITARIGLSSPDCLVENLSAWSWRWLLLEDRSQDVVADFGAMSDGFLGYGWISDLC